jgi:hypothetical protein
VLLFNDSPHNRLMATCPYCKGHLTDTHHCPRRPAFVATERTLAAIAGGFVGLVVVAAIDPSSHVTSLDTMAILAGAGAGVALSRFLRS